MLTWPLLWLLSLVFRGSGLCSFSVFLVGLHEDAERKTLERCTLCRAERLHAIHSVCKPYFKELGAAGCLGSLMSEGKDFSCSLFSILKY